MSEQSPLSPSVFAMQFGAWFAVSGIWMASVPMQMRLADRFTPDDWQFREVYKVAQTFGVIGLNVAVFGAAAYLAGY